MQKIADDLDIVQLIYFSYATNFRNTIKFDRDVRDILDHSRAYNPLHEITSALMTDGEMFAHVVEGPAIAVENLYFKIIRDERHANIITLQNISVHVRLFSFWPIAFIRVKNIRFISTLNAQSSLTELRKASVLILKAFRPVLLR